MIDPLVEEAGEWEGDAMDAAIRKTYEPVLANKLSGIDRHQYIDDEIRIFESWDSIVSIDLGFLLFCPKFDWQNGIMECEYIDNEHLRFDWLFGSQSFFGSEFPNADYTVSFSGLKFEASRIELMLPSAQISANIEKGTGTSVARHIGRPRQWDWDGAMAHIVAEAQKPDGLPTGHGAQAKVEAIIAAWFEDQTGNSPAISQIRSKASRMMQMVEKD